ncbi:MAG: DUF294 nucleotidyltransferase-like domain-containing protein [Candidatus Rokuibacteriota bacterium]
MTGESILEPRAEREAESMSSPRADLALFVRQVRELVKGPPVTCVRSARVAEVARLMSERAVGSIIVADAEGEPVGIVTDRDLRTRVLASGLEPSTPVALIMSSPLVSVDREASAFDALLEMTRRGIHHLGVLADGRLAGIVSSHDLLGLQAAHPVVAARQIDTAPDVDALGRAGARVQSVVRWLAASGMDALAIGRIVAELNDRLVRRALGLVQAELETGGHGRAPVAFCWLVAGSEGRREQTLKTDQDNGLVYRDPSPGAEAKAAAYFERLATVMSETLTELGFPRCPGDFMAANPRWRQPESVWRRYFSSWMETPQPEPLLQAALFFDLRPIGGEEEIGRGLWEWVCETAPARTLFLRHLARAAQDRPRTLGLLGGFVGKQVDLKAAAVLPVTHAMRVHALSLGVRPTNTLDRLRAAGLRGIFTAAHVSEVGDAHRVVARLRLTHQLACLDAGLPPDNVIEPHALGKTDRLLLKEALKTIAWLDRGLAERFQTGLVGR